jgi:hypothetical protein
MAKLMPLVVNISPAVKRPKNCKIAQIYNSSKQKLLMNHSPRGFNEGSMRASLLKTPNFVKS